MIKAVIFDMDGLLIDSEPFWKQANIEAFKKVGIDLTDEHRHQMMGRRSSENVAYLYSLYPWEGRSQKEVEAMIVNDVVDHIKQEGKLLPGVHHAIEVCKQASLPIAIASSSVSEVINAVVDTLEIREHFGHIYSAQFEPYGKPHPGVFIKVAEHFKILPEQCLVFEDSPSGVLAAKAAKMKCIAVPEAEVKNHPFIMTADVVIDSLEEFNTNMLAGL